ncbi:MAG: M56 family metallopeptidase [Eubacteriales bacterium]
MTAADIVVNILLLTLLFTLGSGGALLLRRRLLRGRENVMCIIWAAVLLCAVVPFYSSHAVLSFGTDSESDSVTDVSARTEVLYVPGGADENGSIIDAQRDIDLARKLYGENFTAVVVSDGSTVDEGGPDDVVLTAICILLFCIWAAISVFLIFKFLIAYLTAKKIMHDNSRFYTDGHISCIFSECRERLGIRQNVCIRIIREGFSCSPCVVGLFYPEIYMGGECCDYSESRLRYIFMHELCHVGRHDLLFKLCALIVTSLHWFNPLSWLVYRAVAEDCELACDNTVLKILGRQHSEPYMFTILDIAERLCNAPQPVLANRLGNGLFISGSSGKRFLERRYRNMKFTKTSKYSSIAAVLFILAALMVNMVVMSSCGMPTIDSPAASLGIPENGSLGNNNLDEAIRGYYGLPDSDVITSDMIRGIETLVIRASDINSIAGAKNTQLAAITGSISATDAKDAVTIVDYIVNGREILSFPKWIEPRRFEENYLTEIKDYYLKNSADNDSAEETFKKVEAFFLLRNYYDLILDDAGRTVMLTNFPNIDDYPEGCYMYDPYASERETEFISGCYETAGLYDGFSLPGGYFDASALVALPNLVSVTYMGVTPVNERLPAGCISEYQEYQYSDIGYGNMTQDVSAAEGSQ